MLTECMVFNRVLSMKELRLDRCFVFSDTANEYNVEILPPHYQESLKIYLSIQFVFPQAYFPLSGVL
jgi:hypothetical protein